MKKATSVFVLALFAWTAVATAQAPRAVGSKPPLTDAEYEKVMKDIASTFRSLQINNKAMNHGDGEREARRLATWFQDIRAYWEARKADKAVGYAATAVKAAEDIEHSSTAMNMAVLQSAEKTLAGTCQACHMEYRERLPDGSFRIKP
jgi:hypothetical protein